MTLNLWELRSNPSWKDAVSSTQGITRSKEIKVPKEIKKKKPNIFIINYVLNKGNIVVGNFFFCFDTFLSHCFSPLSAFLSSKPFQNNKMHWEIIDCYFNVFFVQIQLNKQNLKSVIWVQEFRLPNQYTSLPKGLDTSLHISVKHTSQIQIPSA